MAWLNSVHGGGQGGLGDDLDDGFDVRMNRGGSRRLSHGLGGRFEGEVRRAKGLANLEDVGKGSHTLPGARLGDALAQGAGRKAGEAKRRELHADGDGWGFKNERTGCD